MSSFIIEIHPKKSAFDPLAKHVRAELIESGEDPKTAAVETRRLFRLEGNIAAADAQRAAETLLVDPVTETAKVEDQNPAPVKGKKALPAGRQGRKKQNGIVLDVWPRPGVTDPVGETVEKGLRDLGLGGAVKASSATRYVFPKISDSGRIRTLAKRILANELIHTIDIRKAN